MFARNSSDTHDDGRSGLQGAGVHPFLLVETARKGDYFGMYFHNSNAQAPIINFNPDGTTKMSYITTGGVIQVFFFLQGSAEFVIQQYHNFIGKPALPPFWALGYFQGSDSYATTADVTNMVAAYKTAKLPLEGVMLGTPYMANKKEFTVDSTAFAGLAAEITALHAANQKVVPVMLPGLTEEPLTPNPAW